jgi:metal-responsive CopG/Arc/MetJ family transcriptional regulator
MAEGDRHKTPRVVVSMPGGLWKKLGALIGDRNRSDLLRSFVAWYVREPGAKLPERPPRKD